MDDSSPPTHDPPAMRPPLGRYRVPVGLPARDDGRRAGLLVSVVIHAAIIGLLIVPFFLPTGTIERIRQGAGGAGPAGGGGGASRGTGGEQVKETLRFVKVMSTPVPTPTTLPPVMPPVTPPVPVVPPPRPAVTPPVTPPPQSTAPAAPVSAAPVASPTSGTGGGIGTDGSAGAGPGSGGGVGSGVGTGRGSADGPGTGGGTQTNYSPLAVRLYLPPLPSPASVRGMTVIAEFDVDSTGRVLDFKFTPTPDGSYNRQMASMLRSVRFRPGHRPDGTPTRMPAQLTFGPL